jgi:hypothetical protein
MVSGSVSFGLDGLPHLSCPSFNSSASAFDIPLNSLLTKLCMYTWVEVKMRPGWLSEDLMSRLADVPDVLPEGLQVFE